LLLYCILLVHLDNKIYKTNVPEYFVSLWTAENGSYIIKYRLSKLWDYLSQFLMIVQKYFVQPTPSNFWSNDWNVFY
jgi:hypothetical protein